MAVTRTVYKIKTFDDSSAMAGGLCVMVQPTIGENDTVTYSDGNTISKVKSDGSENPHFIGVGVCVFKQPNKFFFTCNSKTYQFNENGFPTADNSFDYRLWSAELSDYSASEVEHVGNWIPIKSKAFTKITSEHAELNPDAVIPVTPDTSEAREGTMFDGDADPPSGDAVVTDPVVEGEGGETSGGTSGNQTSHNGETIRPNPDFIINDPTGYTIDGAKTEISYTSEAGYDPSSPTTTNDSQVVVDDLNARDKFAIEALNSLVANISNPAALSGNEMHYYCESAYEWAAHMMTAAAKSRSTVGREYREGTTAETVTNLSNNTEKLLNNLVITTSNISDSLKRTDVVVGTTGSGDNVSNLYAEKITLDKITMSDLQALIDQKRGKTVSGDNVSYTEKSPFETQLLSMLNTYIQHVAEQGETNPPTTVGMDDLIKAVKTIATAISSSGSGSGGGSSSSTGEVLIQPYNGNSLGYSSSYPFVVALGGTGSLGTQGSPLYISGGGGSFPARNSVLEINDSSKINSFLTFTSNTGNAAGYATVNTIRPTIVGSYFDSIISSQDPSLAFATEVKNIIKQWLQGVTSSVTINGNNYLVINSGALSI